MNCWLILDPFQFTSAPDQSYDEYRLSPGFLNEYIFPGGCVPSLSRVTAAMTSSSRLWYKL